ncbi:ABC transporter substrate binding protein [Acanthopleuribacter pedis]|nr:ABC transporter substrate binding protein [Acanthopleuribacter pedis]
MVINSDEEVPYYQQAQLEFQKNLAESRSLHVVNLAGNNVTSGELRNMVVNRRPQVVYAIGSKAYLLLKDLGIQQPIIFSSVINWERVPLERGVHGIANEIPPPVQFYYFRYFFPKVRRVGVLYNRAFNHELVKKAEAAARDVGIELVPLSVTRPRRAISLLEKNAANLDALWLISDPVVFSKKEQVGRLFAIAEAGKLPVFAYSEAFTDQKGVCLVISVDIPTVGRQAAGLIGRVTEDPGMSSRVQSPAGSFITINLKHIKNFGLELNDEALDSVNHIIE